MQAIPTTVPANLSRPRFPSAEDNVRCQLLETRYAIMCEDFEDQAEDWAEEHLSEEKVAIQGPPDLSVNTLTETCRQLSTPGLYQSWKASHPTNDGLVRKDGPLDRAGYFTKMRGVQYFTLGLGDYFTFLSVVEDELKVRLVKPQDVEVEVDPYDPVRALVWTNLRVRWDPLDRCWVYAWDRWDISDPEEPTFTVWSGDRRWQLTDRLAPEEVPAFPRFATGAPFIPAIHYYWRDNGQYWHHNDMRGLTRGALNGVLYATMLGSAAKSASGKAVLIGGMYPTGIGVTAPEGSREGIAVKTLMLTPGAAIYHDIKPGVSPVVVEVGPGSDLKELQNFVWNYTCRQPSVFGLNGTDVLRTTANPDSGAALSIKERGKRDFGLGIEPLFLRHDLEAKAKAAALCRIYGIGDYPEDGYGLEYHRIPLSPDERRELREHLEWQVERGLMSEQEALQVLEPGLTEEAAREKILRARVAKAELDAELKKRLAAAGLELPAPPKPPKPPDPEEEPEDDERPEKPPTNEEEETDGR